MILGPPRGIPDPPGGVGGFWGVYKSWLEHFLGLNYCTPKNILKSSKAGTEGPVKLHAGHMSLCPGFSYYQNIFVNQILESMTCSEDDSCTSKGHSRPTWGRGRGFVGFINHG